MLYLGTELNGLKTGIELRQNAKEVFENARQYTTDSKTCTWFLDMWDDEKAEIIDTIPLNDDGFVAITGLKVESRDVYARADKAYWDRARAIFDAYCASEDTK